MRRLSATVLAASALLALLPAAALADAARLDGGETRLGVPPGDANPSFVIKNTTGAKIADLVVTVERSPIRITGANLVDENQAGEDWDVDDDGNGALDAAERATAPGAEGADPADPAAGNADNQQAAGASVRLEEDGRNQPVDPFRTVELDLSFDNPPGEGAVIVIRPTNSRGRTIVDSKTALRTGEGGLIPGGVALLPFDPAVGAIALSLVPEGEAEPIAVGTLEIPDELLALAARRKGAWTLRLEGAPLKAAVAK